MFPPQAGSTHRPSMFEYGTRLPRFERNALSACGMQPPCTTAQKHTHKRVLTPALKHRHFQVFERPQHTNQTFRSMKEARKKQKYEHAPREVQHFQLQQRISSVFCQNHAGHHLTNQFTPISLSPPLRVHGGVPRCAGPMWATFAPTSGSGTWSTRRVWRKKKQLC